MTSNAENRSRLLWKAAREAEPAPADVAAVVARVTAAERPPARRATARRRRFTAVAGIAAVTALGGYAVPATRAGIQDALDTFAGYFAGGSDRDEPAAGPGRPLRPGDDAPTWVRNPPASGQRVLAKNSGFSLYLLREPGGGIAFVLDRSVGVSDSPQGWAERFRDNALVVLGPGGTDASGRRTDAEGRIPVYGLVARSVARAELVYASGTSVSADASGGGFVLLADPARRPRAIVARGRAGEELQRVALTFP